MTEQSEWQFIVEYVKDSTTDFCNATCRSQLMALKMQIPEVPLAPGAIFDFTCPHCGSRDYLKNEDGNRNKFCGQCGKALDWEEV